MEVVLVFAFAKDVRDNYVLASGGNILLEEQVSDFVIGLGSAKVGAVFGPEEHREGIKDLSHPHLGGGNGTGMATATGSASTVQTKVHCSDEPGLLVAFFVAAVFLFLCFVAKITLLSTA